MAGSVQGEKPTEASTGLKDFAKTTLSQIHVQRTNTMVVLDTMLEEQRVQVRGPARAPKSRARRRA